MSQSGRRSIAVNAANLAGARLFTFGLRGVYILFLASLLGPAAYGLLVYAHSWTQAFLPLSVMGLTAVMSREVSRDRANAPAIASRTQTPDPHTNPPYQ
jgi:O-antigen/teichoic acid export membrane protein